MQYWATSQQVTTMDCWQTGRWTGRLPKVLLASLHGSEPRVYI